MSDPILEARINALQRSLERMKKISAFVKSLEWEEHSAPVQVFKWNQMRNKLLGSVAQEITQTKDKLDEIKNLLKAAGMIGTAWAEYGLCYKQSQKIFHECLDILGAVAFRERTLRNDYFNRNIDENILALAEELIWTCSQSISHYPSLITPAPKEALSKTVGRVVRLRCCDWTLWILPMIAHEFGHVVIGDPECRKRFGLKGNPLKTFVSRLGELDPSCDETTKTKHATYEVKEYLADAFGTYFMGPAYPCAAILLRLSPSSSGPPRSAFSCDEGRAHVTLAVLELMAKGPPEVHEYSALATKLRDHWNGMVKRASDAKSLSVEDTKKKANVWDTKKGILDELVAAILKQFHNQFTLESCCLIDDEAEGRSFARRWSNAWIKQLDDKSDLTVPKEEITSRSALRDALNAAWYARIDCPGPVTTERIDAIAKRASELCQEICIKRREAGTTSTAPSSTR